jgi:dihydroflavonol-4-reductase
LEQNVVDVRDVAEGHVQAAERGRQAERYILGGTNMRVDALMRRIAEVLDAPTPKMNLPTRRLRVLARAMNFGALGAVSNHLFGIEEWRALSTTKAEKELGYRNRSLEITLRDTINWYQERGILPRGETVV